MMRARDTKITLCYHFRRILESNVSLHLVILLTFTLTDSKPTDSTTYDHNEVTCFKCPRGTHVTSHCTESFTRSNCTTCEPGTYQAQTVTQLEKCGQCDNVCQDHNAIVVEQCSPKHNLRCRCRDGYYNVHHGQGVMACVRHTACPPGQVIVKRGDSQQDATCDWCPTGQYYNADAHRCSVCSVCGDYNEALIRPCTKTNNTMCGDHNVDVIPTAPSTAVPNVVIVVTTAAVGLVAAASVTAVCWWYFHRARTREWNQPHERMDLRDIPQDVSPDIWAKDVFFYLKNRLSKWEDFLRCLPHGNRDFDADLEIDRHAEKKPDLKIYDILLTWYAACFDHVTIGNVVQALNKSKNTNLIAGVIKEYKQLISCQHSQESVKEDGASSADENEAALEVGVETPLMSTAGHVTGANYPTSDCEETTLMKNNKHQTKVKEIYSEAQDQELTQVVCDIDERHQTRVKEV
ncbi:tumor necrosis factor receptor superfamily member 11B-like [Haliotis asinina]|uniref:tumor necrosis factor receptor superfamily member 11B-like n=1 Tax=Haliotis asinina TaxID=109174 RepID=UPI0035324BD9